MEDILQKSHDVLKHQRAEIDRLDTEIIALLAQRFQIVEQVATIKHAHNIPARLPDRVNTVIESCVEKSKPYNLDETLVRTIWTHIIETAIAQENKTLQS